MQTNAAQEEEQWRTQASTTNKVPSNEGPRWVSIRRRWPVVRHTEWIIFVIALSVSLSGLLGGVAWSPDSTNYIVGAQHLLVEGDLYVYANWPSHKLVPEPEPYADYPPGFALYLCPFLWLFADPMLASTLAQAVSVMLCYGALAFLLGVLRLPLVYRATAYAVFTILGTFPHIYGHFWTEPLFTALSFVGGAFTVLAWRPEAKVRHWALAALCFLLASSIKHVGVFNFAWFVLPLMRMKRRRLLYGALSALVCFAPSVAWLLRNQLRYGRISFSHRIGETSFKDDLLAPIFFLGREFFAVAHAVWPGYALAGIVGTLVFVLPFSHAHKGARWLRPARDPDDLWVHGGLVFVTLAHFLGIWALSLVTHFNLLDDRLLAPSIACGTITAMHALHLLGRRIIWPYGRMLAATLPFLFLLVSRHIAPPKLPPAYWHLRQPPEEALWASLREDDIASGSSHFYSDYLFIHQVYAGMPQRILWDVDTYSTPEALQKLTGLGTRPFFVFREGSREHEVFRAAWTEDAVGLEEYGYPNAKTLVYALPARLPTHSDPMP